MTIKDLITKYAGDIAEVKLLLKDTQNIITDVDIVVAIDKSYKCINKYMDWITFDIEYNIAVYSLTIAYLNNDIIKNNSAINKRLVTQKSEGSRSCTYAKGNIDIDSNGLTEDVKAMLPLSKLRCF